MKKNEFELNDLFDQSGGIFMGSKNKELTSKIALFGVNYDGTTSFRPGARFGPSSIRAMSYGLETYCPYFNSDIDEIKFMDFGSLNISFGGPEPIISKVKLATSKLMGLGLKPILMGGEHTISIGSVAAATEYYSDLIVLQIDAHADLREEWLGSRFNHACTMKRCLEILPSKKLFQIGVRSGTKQEFQELKKEKRLLSLEKDQSTLYMESALKPFLGCPVYITLDLDWFDPSVLPGTGTPEPGGYYWKDFQKILNILKKHNIVGADVVELSPNLDPTGISSILAAKVVRSLIILLNNKN